MIINNIRFIKHEMKHPFLIGEANVKIKTIVNEC